jgi:hypothetical protein
MPYRELAQRRRAAVSPLHALPDASRFSAFQRIAFLGIHDTLAQPKKTQ